MLGFRVLDIYEVLKSRLHLLPAEAGLVQRMHPKDQLVCYDAGSPHIRFLKTMGV
jgi:hypothetical protein